MKTEPKPATEEQIRQLGTLLEGESTMVLSVVDAEGLAYAAPVFYVTGAPVDTVGAEQLDLLWLSSADSVHSLALSADPHVAVTVYRPTFAWREIAGAQMRGCCSIVEGAERQAILVRYCQRFQLGAVLGLAIKAGTLYRFRPEWVRLVDNRQGFGWKAEFVLPA
jgi:uncharacterized protein YhbP (UPF0306 family)